MFCKRSHAVLLNHPDLVVRMEMQSELIWGEGEGNSENLAMYQGICNANSHLQNVHNYPPNNIIKKKHL